MSERHLLAKLQGIPPDKYEEIVSLVEANKSVFDKRGLNPNAIDCLDRAVKQARFKEGEEAYDRILGTYNWFVAVLKGVEHKPNYWNTSSRGGEIQVPTIELVRTLKTIFYIYAVAELRLHHMPEYARRLIP